MSRTNLIAEAAALATRLINVDKILTIAADEWEEMILGAVFDRVLELGYPIGGDDERGLVGEKLTGAVEALIALAS